MSCTRNYTIDVQGHRGARGLAPENTIYGFKKALDIGVNTLELDVVISKDHKVLVSHEHWMSKKKCDLENDSIDEKIGYNIYNMTYDQIKKIDCGSKINYDFLDQVKLPLNKPLLEDVFTEIGAYARMKNLNVPNYNIEIKSSIKGDDVFHPKPNFFSDLVYNVIDNSIGFEKVNIQSFDFRILNYFNKKYPDIILAVLINNDLGPQNNLNKLGFIPDIYSPNFKLLDRSHIIFLKNKKIKILPWTVNTYDDIADILKLDVDGIISDYPDRVIKMIE